MNDAPAGGLARRNTIDPVTLEVLRNALEATADEMGAVLKRTSFSPTLTGIFSLISPAGSLIRAIARSTGTPNSF